MNKIYIISRTAVVGKGRESHTCGFPSRNFIFMNVRILDAILMYFSDNIGIRIF